MGAVSSITALVIDDERAIAEDLAHQLNARPGWEAAFETNPQKVMHTLNSSAVDVCFLDIEMPGIKGLELAEKIQQAHPDILIIFATAFSEFAANAYRIPATDYLVKPIGGTLLAEACARVEKQLAEDKVKATRSDTLITVKSVGRTDYVKISDIIMGQAAGNYVRLVCEGKEYLHRCSFTDLTEQLSNHGFLRCHRSFFINPKRVLSLSRTLQDGDELILEAGLKAPVSHSYKKALKDTLSSS